MSQLPEIYGKDTCPEYYKFFLKWGSHFVHEVMTGGSVTIDCIVDAGKYKKQDEMKLKNYFKSKFESFGVQFVAGNLATDGEHTSVAVIDPNYEIVMLFTGGKLSKELHNPISNLNFLTVENFQLWRDSISQNPTELKRTIKLTPLHLFASNDKRKASLSKATIEYLDSSMIKKYFVQKKRRG